MQMLGAANNFNGLCKQRRTLKTSRVPCVLNRGTPSLALRRATANANGDAL